MTTHSKVSLRRGAFAATAIAGLAVGSLFPTQSRAQTMPSPANYRGTAACAKFAKSPGLDKAVACEARELDRRIAAAHQQGVDADRRAADADRRAAEAIQRGEKADQRAAEAIQRGAEADHISECADFLMSGMKKGLFTKGAMLVAAKGKVTAVNACEVARSFGHNQKAELSHPSVQ